MSWILSILKLITVNRILWGIYLALLVVLLPHTAWAFDKFEPGAADRIDIIGSKATLIAWMAAGAFEASVAVLTHKLSKHIEQEKKKGTWWEKLSYRYLNAYSFGLVGALVLSSMANLAHAVEYGSEMVLFTKWNIPFGVYAVAFGAALPVISLTFARVLSNVVETETEEDPAFVELKNRYGELRRRLTETERELATEKTERMKADNRYAALGDLVVKLFAEDKRQKIIAARMLWPRLPGSAIALIAESAPSYVSEVLAQFESEKV